MKNSKKLNRESLRAVMGVQWTAVLLILTAGQKDVRYVQI